MHLIYFRFWCKAMRDLGLVDHDEPVARLLTQGMVCHETYRCPEHGYQFPEKVKEGRCPVCGGPVEVGRCEKMSKSRKNVVEPDPCVECSGADTLRVFCLFAAPPEKDLDWSDAGIEGAKRFLERLWRLAVRVLAEEPKGAERDAAAQEALRRKTHRTIARVTEDIERRVHLNTAISAVMELLNACHEYAPVEEPLPRPAAPLREAVEAAVRLLNPFAPHVTEELWERLGHGEMLALSRWPEADPALVKAERITLVVQVNGKVRGKLDVAADASEAELVAAARSDAKVSAHLAGKDVVKTVTVPGRIVNFVVR
jgi:leucyl-tRNA synthetase